MSNSLWAELFPSGRCSYLNFDGSDHRPVITFLEPDTRKKKGLFRYDRKLCKNEEVRKLIAEPWLENGDSVESKISACMRAISKWNRLHHINSQVPINVEKALLEEAITSFEPNESLIAEINARLRKAYNEEEEYWRQRSRSYGLL